LIETARALELIRRFAEHRVVVLGDLILDRYVWGSSERISPEAPVPVVHVDRESCMLGGAGNVARNLSSLGASVELVSLTGDDEAASEIGRLCERWQIDTRHVLRDPGRPTTEKTRIIARAQQLVRYDRECDEPAGEALSERLLAGVRECADRVQGAVIEDYAKGLLSPGVLSEALDTFKRAGVRVFVDPKDPPWDFAGVELVKPNLREAESMSGVRLRGEDDLERLGRRLLELCGAQTVAVTRGGEGMTLFRPGEALLHVGTRPRAVSDVAGAGDTAIATLALARLSGASWSEAAHLSNLAAGVVVSVPGTATVTPTQLSMELGGAA
jgi:D-beta-D-heptose 7-phosphate kinase/D-beta-D-heptose 1-phosphate adenosyltransferase